MTTDGADRGDPSWLWPQWIARGSLTVFYGQEPHALTSMVLMLANSAAWGENSHSIPLQKPAEREEQMAIVVSHVDKSDASQALAASLLGMSSSLMLVGHAANTLQ